jgi:hypothetical protein
MQTLSTAALAKILAWVSIGAGALVDKMSGSQHGCPSAEELDMALYLIAFNDEWVPEHTMDELREKAKRARAVIDDMTNAGVFVFTDGGLDASTVVCSVVPSDGSPVFTDGPFTETKEHLGGFAVVDVADDAQARYWAGRIAVAVDWPQEVHRFPHTPGHELRPRSEA